MPSAYAFWRVVKKKRGPPGLCGTRGGGLGRVLAFCGFVARSCCERRLCSAGDGRSGVWSARYSDGRYCAVEISSGRGETPLGN